MVKHTFTLKEYVQELSRLGNDEGKAGRRILFEIGDFCHKKVKQLAGERVNYGAGLAGHYHERFYQDLSRLHSADPEIEIGNEATNPLYDDYTYGDAIESGHIREHVVPLVLSGKPTALGKWAETILGFQLIIPESGKAYYRTPEGKSISAMRIQLPPKWPMRDAALETEKAIDQIAERIMQEYLDGKL